MCSLDSKKRRVKPTYAVCILSKLVLVGRKPTLPFLTINLDFLFIQFVIKRLALRMTGACFYALTAGLVVAAVVIVWQNQHPTTTVAGAIISILSIAIMRVLAVWKIRTGQRLNAPSITADGNCTMVCVYMSVILLVKSLLYEWFKLPYIDAAGLMGLAWFSYQEGKESFEKSNGAECCCSTDTK